MITDWHEIKIGKKHSIELHKIQNGDWLAVIEKPGSIKRKTFNSETGAKAAIENETAN